MSHTRTLLQIIKIRADCGDPYHFGESGGMDKYGICLHDI